MKKEHLNILTALMVSIVLLVAEAPIYMAFGIGVVCYWLSCITMELVQIRHRLKK